MTIRIRNLCKAFGSKVVLKNLNLDIQEKSSFVLLGESGSGKSVLIKCLLGLIKPDSGNIYLGDEDITYLSGPHRLEILSKFGVLFQSGALFDGLNIGENIAFRFRSTIAKEERKRLAAEKLEAVRLNPDILERYPSELSGGMQKRAALARAIAHNPSILCFDEPTSGLDPVTSETINELILGVVRKLGGTAITITHDLISMKTIGDSVGFLEKGEIAWMGAPHDIKNAKLPSLQNFIKPLVESL